jgi:hypothetical protein
MEEPLWFKVRPWLDPALGDTESVCVCVNYIFSGEVVGNTEVHLVIYRAFQILD